MMAWKIIESFSQSIDISRKLAIVITFQHGYQKDCLMKVLNLLLHLSLAPAINHVNAKSRVKFDGSCLTF